MLSTYNASDGLIVVQDALSPEPLILQGIQNQYSEESDFKQKVRLLGAIPELNRISDVIFLEWQLQCNRKGTDPRNLLISILHSVHTTETVQVIDHILDTRGCHKVATPDRGGTYEPPIWKHRITLMPGTQDFYAVLGTPDAAINAYLLLQHKIQLGHKRVKAIHISLDSWTPPGDKRPYDGATLTFEFEDVPQDFGSLESGEAAWMGQSVLQRGNVQGKSQSSKQPQQGGSKDVWPERLKEPPQLESASPQAESSKQPEQVEGSAVQANSSKKPKSPGGKKKFWNKGGLSGKTKGGT